VDYDRESTDLDLDDVIGKRIITTSLTPTVTIREENAIAALEVMSRFAADPRWLIYLPPTMSPTATSDREGLLEHPAEAFQAFRRDGIQQVICEEKHMGSRAVVIVCREEEVADRRFGIAPAPAAGAIVTRTGRPFFSNPDDEHSVLDKVRAGMQKAGLWEELDTDWVALDSELLPWSAKAEELLRRQYASVGAAATAILAEQTTLLQAAAHRGAPVEELLGRTLNRQEMAAGFVNAYRKYCWPTDTADDLRLAPFQILAGEGHVHALTNHAWHLDTLGRLCQTTPDFFRPTQAIQVDLANPNSEAQAVTWWEELTNIGGEGMVVKPLDVIHRNQRGLTQPGIKCRGREYLRIIYGPEYTAEHHLSRLRARGLGHKRSLALREFALGIEALQRFVNHEPLYRVHECVFGVLALESEPVDPRL
jgi:protein phosphatase